MRFAGLGKSISKYMPETPRYDRVGAMGVMDSAQNEANQAMNNAYAADAVMRGKASIASAEAQADAIRAGGQARGQASMVGSIAGGLGGLGSSLLRSSGGGSSISGMQSYMSGRAMAPI
jgi:hypothetical protein